MGFHASRRMQIPGCGRTALLTQRPRAVHRYWSVAASEVADSVERDPAEADLQRSLTVFQKRVAQAKGSESLSRRSHPSDFSCDAIMKVYEGTKSDGTSSTY